MYSRILTLVDSRNDTVFLWGARQTGKSTLLKKLFPDCRYYDLLKGEVFERLYRRPELLREELLACEENELIIIDEVQKVPQLLDEVHWLMTNQAHFRSLPDGTLFLDFYRVSLCFPLYATSGKATRCGL